MVLDFSDTLGHAPDFLFVSQKSGLYMMALVRGMTDQTSYPAQPTAYQSTVEWTDTGVTWYGNGAVAQLNNGGTEYVWLAVG